MYSKKATEVTRVVMDMMLRLRADGYHIGHIHSDQGHEFQGHFKRWCRERGVLLTRTPGDDPKSRSPEAHGTIEKSWKNSHICMVHFENIREMGSVVSEAQLFFFQNL
jgi:hypothetical protein